MPGVSTSPGWMLVILIPCLATSSRIEADIPSTKNFVPQYTAKPSKPCSNDNSNQHEVVNTERE